MKSTLKTFMSMASAAIIPLGFTSCHTMGSHAKDDAATGALLGAGAGALIGKQSDRTAEGALLGAAVGGAAGAAIGSQKDKTSD